MRTLKQNAAIALGASIGTLLAAPQAGFAQGMEEIVVTSRRVAERLLDAPITVTAFSSETIQARGGSDLRSIAMFTPGLTVSTQGGGNNNATRFIQNINMRGMNKAGLVTVFLDGMATKGALQGLDDVERMEIIKGPQSALFGRSTFAGAISVVSKDPAQKFGGRIDALYGSNAWTDDRITLEGPLLADKLSARVSGRFYSTHGQYANTAIPGTRLNDQQTTGVNAKFLLTPTEDIRISAFVKYDKSEDGPGALGRFDQQDYNCNGGAAPAGRNNYICGTLPAYKASRLASATIMTPAVTNTLFKNAYNTWNPLFSDNLGLDHGGMMLIDRIGVFNVEYTSPSLGVTFSSVTGVEKSRVVQYTANQNLATNLNPAFANTAYISATATPTLNAWRGVDALVHRLDRNWSQEFRASSDATKRLRGVLGANYNFTSFQIAAANIQATSAQQNLPGAANNTLTSGIFGSVSYDVLPEKLTANFEGRYQIDRIQNKNRVANGAADALTPFLSGSTKTFLYRGILQYHVTPDIQIYATTAKAVNPGAFNNLTIYSPAQQAVIAQQFKVGLVVKPEYLHNYELGVKGQFFDRRLTLSAAIYHADWSDQQVGQSLSVPTVTAAGVPTGGFTLVQGTTNIASTKLNGAEIEGQAQFTDELSAQFAASISASKLNGYICSLCTRVNGIQVLNGTTMPLVSKYIFTFGPEYKAALTGEIDWFVRVLYTYRSGLSEGYANYAKTLATNNVDIRVGVTTKQWNVEAFVTNAFNNKAPTGVEQNSDVLSPGQLDAVINVTMPWLRRFGIRAKYNF